MPPRESRAARGRCTAAAFYHVEKYQVAPAALPAHLIWFRWEAYLTWLTGFALLVVQYYLNPGAWLIDPAVMALAPTQAVMISIVEPRLSGGSRTTGSAAREWAIAPCCSP